MTIIKHFQDKEIRFQTENNQTLICVKDVLEAIGYKDPARAWSDMKDEIELISNSMIVSKQLWYPKLGRSYASAFANEKQLATILMTAQVKPTVEFRQWAINVICKEIKQQSKFKTLTGTEQQLSNELVMLASRSRNNITFEYNIEDPYQQPHKDGNLRCRRMDLIEAFPRMTRVYEIKRGELTADEVFNTINKFYIELATSIAPGKPVDFVMVSPTITDEAKAYISRYDAEEVYRPFSVLGLHYRAKIRWMSVNELADLLYAKALKITPPAAVWQLNQHCLTYCSTLFNDIQLQGFKQKLFNKNVVPIKYLLEEAA